jgi:hypothetical protein
MVIGVGLLFAGGAWFFSELEGLGNRQRRFQSVFLDFLLLGAPLGMLALLVAAAGGYIVWNGLSGGPLLLDADAVRPWIPDHF